MKNISWEHEQKHDKHFINGYFPDHNSHIQVTISLSGWEFEYKLGEKLQKESNLFHVRTKDILTFSLLSIIQQENAFLFKKMIDLCPLTQHPFSFLKERTKKRCLTHMEYKEISFSTSEASFVIYYQLVDDLCYQYWGVEYQINKKRHVETNPLYETTLSEKEKEWFVDELNVPEKHLMKEIPFDLIEKEPSFKPYLRNVKKLFKTIRSLKKPDSFTYNVIEEKTIDGNCIYTIEMEELPAFVVKCRFKKNKLVESDIYLKENEKIIHRFSFKEHVLFLENIEEYMKKKSIYRVRFLM